MKLSSKFTAILVVVLSAGAMPKLALAADAQLAHDMKQAQLYLESGVPGRAIALLEKDTANGGAGQSDAMTWLLLARAYAANQQLDKAGEAVTRAESLGVDARLKEQPWAESFYTDFRGKYGALQIIDAPCDAVSVPIKLAAPTTAEKQKILEGVPGWTQKKLTRATNLPIYLPVASFRLGETVVEIEAGKTVKLAAGEAAATCEVIATIAPASEVVEQGGSTDSAQSSQDLSWLWWVAGGVAVAAGGTAGVLLATRSTVYNYDFTPR
jgi:hypothetical protein